MAALLAGGIWAGLAGWLLLRLLRQFRAHRDASLDAPADIARAPPIAVIVPARNEIGNIRTCLAGLGAQRGLTGGLSITVVDDSSQDGTAAAVTAMAQDDKRIRLISAGELPAG